MSLTTTPASNSNNSSDDDFYRVVSTLVQVTQSFLSQVTALQNNTNKHNYEPLVSSVMEHYERLNLVMRVSKIAIPLALPLSEQEGNLVNTTMDQITTTVAHSLSTIPTPVIGSITANTGKTMKSFVPPSPPVVVKQKQQNTQQDLPLIEQMMEKKKETTLKPVIKQEQEQCSLSSNEFLNQFENTAKKFAIQNKMNLKDIWESLFIHALPSNKMDWAHKYILKRSMDWYEAKATYLKYFPDTVKTTLVIKKEHSQLQVKKKKKKQLPNYVNNAKLMTLAEKTTEEAKNAMVDRQARYAQHLLYLKMKEYDSIDEFNIRFKRYCVAACMNLFDASLSKRYIASLLPKYQQMVTSNTALLPNNLDEIMSLTAKLVEGHENFTIQPKPCWKQHTTSLKRVAIEQPEDTRMHKKYSCI